MGCFQKPTMVKTILCTVSFIVALAATVVLAPGPPKVVVNVDYRTYCDRGVGTADVYGQMSQGDMLGQKINGLRVATSTYGSILVKKTEIELKRDPAVETLLSADMAFDHKAIEQDVIASTKKFASLAGIKVTDAQISETYKRAHAGKSSLLAEAYDPYDGKECTSAKYAALEDRTKPNAEFAAKCKTEMETSGKTERYSKDFFTISCAEKKCFTMTEDCDGDKKGDEVCYCTKMGAELVNKTELASDPTPVGYTPQSVTTPTKDADCKAFDEEYAGKYWMTDYVAFYMQSKYYLYTVNQASIDGITKKTHKDALPISRHTLETVTGDKSDDSFSLIDTEASDMPSATYSMKINSTYYQTPDASDYDPDTGRGSISGCDKELMMHVLDSSLIEDRSLPVECVDCVINQTKAASMTGFMVIAGLLWLCFAVLATWSCCNPCSKPTPNEPEEQKASA